MNQSSSRPLGDYELMECIERGLNRFGPSIKYAVMWRMVVLGDAPKEGILVKPEAFVTALESIFGRSAKLMEQAVLDEVRTRIGPEKYLEIDNLTDMINSIRKHNLIEQILD
jgi:hypothetical protein